ncbi:MAG: TolC family protein [Desulfobacter sp.]|nr:MAG: TolC family protein [Desulfobacter sp.]
MKIHYSVLVAVSLFLILLPASAPAKSGYKIAIITRVAENAAYRHQVVREINALLKSRGRVEYQEIQVAPYPLEKSLATIRALTADDTIDCIVGVGPEISDVLIRMGDFKIPVVATGIIDRKLQGLAMTAAGTSGIPNFNYIETHFDVERDFRTFKSLYDFHHLAILLPVDQTTMFHTLYTYFGRTLEQVDPASKLSIVDIDPARIEPGFPDIPPEADAVYLLPFFSENSDEQMKNIIQAVNERKLPSFALMGEKHVRMGAMASIAPERNLNAVSRRVAINVLDILEGRDAGTLPVSVVTYTENFVVNVETLREIDVYPGWEALEGARLLNLEKLSQGPGLQLKQVILEALDRNLDLLSARSDTRIQEMEAGMAGAALLPQVNLSAGLTQIDENRVEVSQTHPARTTVSGSAGVTQAVFADDLLANFSVQKLLTESRRCQEKTVLMDTVVAAGRAYIQVLFAMSSQAIQNNNLEMTRKNFDIARSKAAVGAVDASEVSRWESEMAANLISLNDVFRDLQLARMSLNQVLDRPIDREFTPEDVGPVAGIELMITDPEVYGLLGNLKRLKRFSDFLILEADRNLPELKGIKEDIRSQERVVLNRERALYLPDISLKGSVDKIVEEFDARQKTPGELDHPWSVSLMASWPIFRGGADKKDLAQSRERLRQLYIAERNLRSQLHLNIRSKLETASVSAREIELSEKGLAAALKNFEIVQAGYAEGRNSVTDLIDAQNARLRSERAAAAAKYQFVLDFLELERAMGRFYFLDTPEQKSAFLSRLREYMDTTPTKDDRKNG